MKCERFIEKFAEAEVNLFEFLTITDERLKEIGIEFKFERNIILMGLYNFHNEPWSHESLFVPDLREDFSDVDIMMMLANVQRQLAVVESQFIYMQRLGKEFDIKRGYKNLSTEFVEELRGNLKELKKLMGKKKVKRPLMIKKEKSRIEKFVKCAAVGIIPIVLIFAFKFVKK